MEKTNKRDKGKDEEIEAILLPIRLRGRVQVQCPICSAVSLWVTIKELGECPYCGQELRVSEKKGNKNGN